MLSSQKEKWCEWKETSRASMVRGGSEEGSHGGDQAGAQGGVDEAPRRKSPGALVKAGTN